MSRQSSVLGLSVTRSKAKNRQPRLEKQEQEQIERHQSRRALIVLGVLVTLVCSIGALANWRSGGSSYGIGPIASASNGAAGQPAAGMMFAPTPTLPANAPSKEYVYAGSALLATSEPFRQPPDDYAVWRPGNGTWYVMNSQQQWVSQQWGTDGDAPVPGDYDGDGKTDFSVFTPTNNTWYISYSGGGTQSTYFAASGDKVAQADYDGDGKTDKAVFRPSNGTWYISRSSDGNLYSVQFGLDTDTPAPADYDGDGKADIAVWRNGAATFYVLKSTDNQTIGNSIGQSGDVPVPGDYDGDGYADYAVRRPANSLPDPNTWFIRYSGSGVLDSIVWGQSKDKLVQGDYDHDGKTDIAVWRPATGVWYVRKSTAVNLTFAIQWGQNLDIPVPAPYRRF